MKARLFALIAFWCLMALACTPVRVSLPGGGGGHIPPIKPAPANATKAQLIDNAIDNAWAVAVAGAEYGETIGILIGPQIIKLGYLLDGGGPEQLVGERNNVLRANTAQELDDARLRILSAFDTLAIAEFQRVGVPYLDPYVAAIQDRLKPIR